MKLEILEDKMRRALRIHSNTIKAYENKSKSIKRRKRVNQTRLFAQQAIRRLVKKSYKRIGDL